MSLTEESTLRVLLYEGAGATELPSPNRLETMTALLERGYTVSRTTGTGSVAPHDRGSLYVLGQFEGGKTPTDQIEHD